MNNNILEKQLKIVMVSNYINHHQLAFTDALYNLLDGAFAFIQTEEMEEERQGMGWKVDETNIPYLVKSYDNPDYSRDLIMSCDLLLAGWTRDTELITERCRSGKPALRMSERIYREGQWRFISPKGLINKYREHIRFRNNPIGLLCCGAYVASDFNLLGAYSGKKYRFGYFPPTRRYDMYDELRRKKNELEILDIPHTELLPFPPAPITEQEINIVWSGRFIPLKHPEYPVRIASTLARLGYRFHIHMIGDGEMMSEIRSLIDEEMVESYITLHGFVGPQKARDIMETCHVHLFTSNFLEGWGAVVNEGMNAGCATVVNKEVGSAPYLIEEGVNGYTYPDGDYGECEKALLKLMDSPELISRFGQAGYDTIVNEWNAETAAKRIVDYYRGVMGEEYRVPESGPLSVAPVINPGFFKTGRL